LILLVFFFIQVSTVVSAQSIDIVHFFKNNKRVLPIDVYPFDSQLTLKILKIKSVKEYKIDIEKNDTVLINLYEFDTLGRVIRDGNFKLIYGETDESYDIINLQTNKSVLAINYGVLDGVYSQSTFFRYNLNRNLSSQLIESNEVVDFELKKHKLIYKYNTKIVHGSYCFNVEDLDVWVDNSLPIFIDKLEYYKNDKLIQINYLEIERH
jgi:hypothetical protein